MSIRNLAFSSPVCSAVLVAQEPGYAAAGEAVVVNASTQEARVGPMRVPPGRSAVVADLCLGEGHFIVLSSPERLNPVAPGRRRERLPLAGYGVSPERVRASRCPTSTPPTAIKARKLTTIPFWWPTTPQR